MRVIGDLARATVPSAFAELSGTNPSIVSFPLSITPQPRDLSFACSPTGIGSPSPLNLSPDSCDRKRLRHRDNRRLQFRAVWLAAEVMVRYNADALDDEFGDDVEVDEANSDPVLQPWQDNFWKQPGVPVKKEPGIDEDPSDDCCRESTAMRLLKAALPFGRSQEESPWNHEDDDNLEKPSYIGSIHFIGTRSKREKLRVDEKDGDDSDDGTIDLTDVYALQETPAEVPQYVRNAFPQVRNKSKQNRLGHSTGQLCANKWVQQRDGEMQASSPHVSPLSSPRNPPLDHRSRKCRSIFWSFVAVIVGILAKYIISRAPPPPPPAAATLASTWREYFSSSVSDATQNVAYVLSAIAVEIQYDYSRLFSHQCRLVFPEAIVSGVGDSFDGEMQGSVLSSPIEDFLLKEIVGQDTAIRIVARGLDYWAESSQLVAAKGSHGAVPVHASESKPYVIVFSGSEGVGKTTLARRIARLAFQHCPKGQDGVLELHGQDFEEDGEAITTVDSESGTGDSRLTGKENIDVTPAGYLPRLEPETGRLTEVVVDHLRRRKGAGAVVILRQFDRIHPSLVRELLTPLSRGSEAKLSYRRSTEGDNEQSVVASCQNALFILTTDVGNRSIIQGLRSNEGMSHAPLPDLERAIKGELDAHFGHISQVINVVAPFAMLGRNELEDIMGRRIKAISSKNEGKLWKRLDVAQHALHLLTGPDYVTYVQLLRKEGAIRPFSERGAHPLDDGVLMQMLKGRVLRYLAGNSDRIKLDHIAVFSISPKKKTAVLSWCPDNGTVYKDAGGAGCSELWHEPLQ